MERVRQRAFRTGASETLQPLGRHQEEGGAAEEDGTAGHQGQAHTFELAVAVGRQDGEGRGQEGERKA